MSEKSLKINVAVNVLRTLSTMIFPMITFPYTSRVLGPEGTGKLNFAGSFVGYFTLFAALGIPMYGIREVARARGDKQRLSEISQELFVMHLVASVVAFIGFLVVVRTNGQIHAESALFLVSGISILLASMSLDWLYQGLEEYVYITVRSIVVTSLCVVGLFLFVKTSQDYVINAFMVMVATTGSAVFNFFNVRKVLVHKRTAPWNFRRHLKPMLTMYSFNLVVSVYLSLDTVMLGFLSTSASVGYYSAAMKLTKMLLALVTSLGSVLLPRLSYYIANGKHEEFDRMLDKSFSVVLLICLPIVAGLMLLSSETLQVFAGSKFLPAASCTLFTAPVILFIGLSNILGIQILYPLGKDKLVVASVTVGAVLSFVLNLILIPRFAHFGAAVATLVAEFGVFAVQVVLVAKVYRIRWPFASIAKYAAAVGMMTVAVLSVKWAVQPAWERLLVGVPIGAVVYTGLVLAMKDKFAVESAGVLLAKVRRA